MNKHRNSYLELQDNLLKYSFYYFKISMNLQQSINTFIESNLVLCSIDLLHEFNYLVAKDAILACSKIKIKIKYTYLPCLVQVF